MINYRGNVISSFNVSDSSLLQQFSIRRGLELGGNVGRWHCTAGQRHSANGYNIIISSYSHAILADRQYGLHGNTAYKHRLISPGTISSKARLPIPIRRMSVRQNGLRVCTRALLIPCLRICSF